MGHIVYVMTYTCPNCKKEYQEAPRWCDCQPHPQNVDIFELRSPEDKQVITENDYKKIRELLKSRQRIDDYGNRMDGVRETGYTLIRQINDSTPGQGAIGQEVTTLLTKEEYEQFKKEVCA